MFATLVFGYLLVLIVMFAGASIWPRLRWPLLIFGTLGVLIPVIGLVGVLVYLGSHPLHIG